jgi:(R,R)-butanediol dehydrogenase/meso-butanediol dehydrogenase/diacetyl reductase
VVGDVRAALITGAAKVELMDFPDPVPADTGVVVDIAFCGICGTDLQAYVSGRAYTPAICGHEWTGTISATGRAVSRGREGERVVVGVPEACGSCAPCVAGHLGHCLTSLAFVHGRDPEAPLHGGFASRIAVSVDRVIAAHAGLDDETLAQVEPVTVSLHAVNRSALRSGDTAVVLGAGPVGLTTMQCAWAAGAGQVLVIEPSDTRRAMATALGATAVASVEAAADVVAEHTGGLGADVAYECVGGGDPLGSAVDLARRGGSVCMIGFRDAPAAIEPSTWLRKEITVTAALGYLHHEFGSAMDLLADGLIRVDVMHTATTKIEGLAATLDELASGASSQMKVLVNPRW